MNSDKKELSRGSMPPGQVPIKKLLRWGVDHPGIKASNPRIDLKTYKLTIDGEVEKPVTLSWNEILTLPKTASLSNFHCVEGWSVMNCRWEGIRFKDLVKTIKLKNTALFATFEGLDGYTSSLTLAELSGDDVILAYSLNGKPLEEGYGFPIRLIVPDKYGYKSTLWLTRITFTSKKELGYWERRGYSDKADIWKNERFSR